MEQGRLHGEPAHPTDKRAIKHRICMGYTKEGLKCQAPASGNGFCPGHRKQAEEG